MWSNMLSEVEKWHTNFEMHETFEINGKICCEIALKIGDRSVAFLTKSEMHECSVQCYF